MNSRYFDIRTALDRRNKSGRAREMTKLNIQEMSAVDHPANLTEGYLVIKSACVGAGCVECHILDGCTCTDPGACATAGH